MERRNFIKGLALFGAAASRKFAAATVNSKSDNTLERNIYKIINSYHSNLGSMSLYRAFSGEYRNYVEPFFVLDEFGPMNVKSHEPFRVDAHPHAGIIPMTYMLEGDSHHRDSLGNDHDYQKGDFLIFTAGRGALHMEETGLYLKENGGVFHGFQAWLNIPAALKNTEPHTELFKSKDIQSIEDASFRIKVLLGEAFGIQSKARMLFPVTYLHATIKPGGTLQLPVQKDENLFIYVINGTLELSNGKKVNASQLVLFERGGTTLTLKAIQHTELLILGGAPNDSPYVAKGPFVVNTREDLAKCYDDYMNGRLGNPDKVNGR